MKIKIDYINFRIPILRLSHGKQYQIADNVAVGDVVMTRNCLDVGLVAEVSAGKPTKILARDTSHLFDGAPPQYGGINSVTWYSTGVRMSFEDWAKLSRSTDAAGFYEYWHTRLHIKAV